MAQPAPRIGFSGSSAIRDWLGFDEPGRVDLRCGKVELGQGILTSLAQLAATQLGVDIGRISITSGDTRVSPNEGFTGASLSVELSGLTVLRAALSARRELLGEAARLLNAGVDTLEVADGAVLRDGERTSLDYWTLAQTANLAAEVDQDVGWSDCAPGGLVGESVPRIDLLQKLTGGGFIHDVDLPQMLHGRVLRPPSFGARLVTFDAAAVSAVLKAAQAWRDGSFVGVVAESEYAAVRALEQARSLAVWDEADTLPAVVSWSDYLMRQASIDVESTTGEPLATVRSFSATYSKPPIAHASMAPACALAQWDDSRLTVWSSTQGVFNLQSAIAEALDLPAESVSVIHAHGAGCYGHNGAEDAAMDAALLARAFAPRPVRVQWSREDELAWAPFGSPMAVKLSAGLTEEGRISSWSAEIWSGTHVRRPGFLPGLVDLIAADHLAQPKPMSDPRAVPMAFVGSDRNADPAYVIPHVRILRHHLPDLPLRLSSLRALGGFANVFAAECFMDELAEAAGLDPVEFRLRHLEDPRARRVIETAASLADPSGEVGLNCGRGLGFARYKNTAAYVAVVAEVEIGDEMRLRSLTGAADAGLVINPDGVLNQIEGGAVQAASWVLREEVTFDPRMITSNSWDRYPILKFSETPALRFELVGERENVPLGVGEASLGPAAAAIGNAAARALGVRIRDLPLTREQVLRAVSWQTD
jgi:CO/xanthine dehydrogenase Mo-binding subunit